MVSNLSKTLLRNVIRHTDTHNRIREEQEMWTSHRAHNERQMEGGGGGKHPLDRGDSPPHHRAKSRKHCQAHMDDSSSESETTSSYYWRRKLQDIEEKDPNRWGHAGFKELYPEKFLSSSDEERGREKTKTGRDKSKDRSKVKKLKKHHKDKKKKAKHKEKEKKHKHKSKKKSDSEEYQWVPKSSDKH